MLNLKNFTSGRSMSRWDHSGAEGRGTTGVENHFAENAVVRGRLCLGEWASDPDRRKVLYDTCQPWSANVFI